MIDAATWARVLAHCRAEAPGEAVGVLLEGTDGLEVLPLPNVSQTPRQAFEVAARDWLGVEARAAATGQEVRVLYHSHPAGPPTLSTTDRTLATPGGQPLRAGLWLVVIGLPTIGPPSARRYCWNGCEWSAAPLTVHDSKHDLP